MREPGRLTLHDKWRMDSDDGGVRIVKPAPAKSGKPKEAKKPIMQDYMENLDETIARETLSWEKGSLKVRKMEQQAGLDLEREQERARVFLETGRWPE